MSESPANDNIFHYSHIHQEQHQTKANKQWFYHLERGGDGYLALLLKIAGRSTVCSTRSATGRCLSADPQLFVLLASRLYNTSVGVQGSQYHNPQCVPKI